jgi:hypothetical protein
MTGGNKMGDPYLLVQQKKKFFVKLFFNKDIEMLYPKEKLCLERGKSLIGRLEAKENGVCSF